MGPLLHRGPQCLDLAFHTSLPAALGRSSRGALDELLATLQPLLGQDAGDRRTEGRLHDRLLQQTMQ